MSILSSSQNDKPLKGETIAVLVASGFNERDMTESMRALMETGAKITLISPDGGLVQGWNGTGFGHYHAVETPLSGALAADFSMLLVLSGARAMDKLKLSAHTTRFLKSFLMYGNPVALFGDAIQLLSHIGMATGRTVSGPDSLASSMTAAGATWSESSISVSENVLTGRADEGQIKDLVVATVAHFMNIPAELRIAA